MEMSFLVSIASLAGRVSAVHSIAWNTKSCIIIPTFLEEEGHLATLTDAQNSKMCSSNARKVTKSLAWLKAWEISCKRQYFID